MFNSYLHLAYKQKPASNLKAYGINLLSKGSLRGTYDMPSNKRGYSGKRRNNKPRKGRAPLRRAGRTNLISAMRAESILRNTRPYLKRSGNVAEGSGVKRIKYAQSKALHTLLSTSALTDMICPKFKFSTPFCHAVPYNVIDMDNHDRENATADNTAYPNIGQRSFSGDQDFVQHLHMPVKMWFEGIRRASISSKAIALAGNIPFQNENGDLTSGSSFLGTDINNLYSPNIVGTMENYSCDYTLTSVSESPITIEFTEICPNKILYGSPTFVSGVGTYANSGGGNNTNVGSLTVIVNDIDPDSDKDPIAALKRDLREAADRTGKIDYLGGYNSSIGKTNAAGSDFNETFVAKSLNSPGVSWLDARDNFRRDYNILSRKTVVVLPGETIKYRLVIPGFKQNAKRFSRYDNKFKISSTQAVVGGSYASDTLFERVPLFDEHTRFLTIRAYGSKLVGSNLNDNSVSLSAGAYKIVSKINCGFQYMPYVRKNTNSMAIFDSGFSLDTTAAAITVVNTSAQSTINPETNVLESDATVDL